MSAVENLSALSHSAQCIPKLLQELPTHGLLSVPARDASILPAGAHAAQREVLHPPVGFGAPRPPLPALHFHPRQPPGTPTPPQDHHAPSALWLGLQSLGAKRPPRPQAGLRPGAHLVLLRLLHARLHPETRLRMPEAAERREPAGRLQPALRGAVRRCGRGRGAVATCESASCVAALLLPPHKAEELLHPQCD